MELVLKIIQGIFNLLGSVLMAVYRLFSESEDHDLHAAFGRTAQVLRRYYLGFCLGTRALNRETSFKNFLLIGQTGSGKTTKVIMPSAFNMVGSTIIINDPAGGEIYDLTSGYFADEGYDIKVISFPNSSFSDGFNPLTRATPSNVNQVVATLTQANMTGGNGDVFWTNSAQSLIVLCYELLRELDPVYQNIANILDLLTLLAGEPDKVDYLYSKYAPGPLFQRYKATISQSDRTFSGIISTAQASLMVYQNPEVASVTAFDSIDFSELRKRETVIYIQNPILEQQFLAPIVSVFFNQLFDSLMREIPEEDDLDVFFLVDEAATFNINWPLILSQVRKFRVGCCLAVQTYEQLVDAYKSQGAETIRNNCFSQLQFPNMPLGSARDLEQTLGRYTYEDEKGIKRTRSLRTADELRMMEESILLVGNNPPFKLSMTPWYKSKFRKKAAIPPVPKKSRKPFDTIKLISQDLLKS